MQTKEGSHSKGEITRRSPVARRSRHKQWRSPDGSLGSRHKENGHPEKVRGRPSLIQGRRKDKPDSARVGHQDRRGFADPPLQLNGRGTLPRSPAKATSHAFCQDNPECRPASPKRRRHLSPETRVPLAVPMSRLSNQVGALEVALDELRAPGGAFLRVPGGGTQLEASQRAWLSWQLAHTGANLHWALAELDTLLAAQPGFTCQQPLHAPCSAALAVERFSQCLRPVPSAPEPLRTPCSQPPVQESQVTSFSLQHD